MSEPRECLNPACKSDKIQVNWTTEWCEVICEDCKTSVMLPFNNSVEPQVTIDVATALWNARADDKRLDDMATAIEDRIAVYEQTHNNREMCCLKIAELKWVRDVLLKPVPTRCERGK